MCRDSTLHGDDEQERKEFVGRELVVGREQSLNGKLRDECLNGELFYSLKEAQIVLEQWRMQYKTRWPHSSLGYRPPAPEAHHPVISTNAIPHSLAVM